MPSKLLDAPEPLSLRSRFTFAARSRMNVCKDSTTTLFARQQFSRCWKALRGLQAKPDKYLPACLSCSKSFQFGQLERVDFFMINPIGISGKNIHKVYCHGHCSLPSSSLCFGLLETIFKGKPGVKLACISVQIGSDSSIGSMTAIRHALKGTTWPPIPFILVQTGL